MSKRVRITKFRLGTFGAMTMTLALAAGVFAYFGATGTSTTHVTTGGAPTTWSFSNVRACATNCDSGSTATGGPLSPGVNSDEIDFQLDNMAPTTEVLNNVTPSMTTDVNGGIYDVVSNAFVDTCQADWFTLTFETTTPGYLPLSVPSNTVTAAGITYVLVSMPANSTIDQSACENLEPQVTLNAS
jgi:hypothetical protein